MSLPTPRLTAHARLRCAQMAVRTKRVKRLVRNVHCTYPGYPGSTAHVATSETEPDLAVVFVLGEDAVPIVLTVLWRGVEFVRPEAL